MKKHIGFYRKVGNELKFVNRFGKVLKTKSLVEGMKFLKEQTKQTATA
jgi:hypothetical protein